MRLILTSDKPDAFFKEMPILVQNPSPAVLDCYIESISIPPVKTVMLDSNILVDSSSTGLLTMPILAGFYDLNSLLSAVISWLDTNIPLQAPFTQSVTGSMYTITATAGTFEFLTASDRPQDIAIMRKLGLISPAISNGLVLTSGIAVVQPQFAMIRCDLPFAAMKSSLDNVTSEVFRNYNVLAVVPLNDFGSTWNAFYYMKNFTPQKISTNITSMRLEILDEFGIQIETAPQKWMVGLFFVGEYTSTQLAITKN